MSSQTLEQKFVYVPKSALITSIFLHVSIPIIYIVLQILEIQGIRVFTPRIKLEKSEQFIQVDVVALPDLTPQELKSIDPTLPMSKDAKAPPVVEPNPLVEEAIPKPDDLVISEQEAKTRAKEKQKKREDRLKKIQEANQKKQFAKDRAKAMAALEADAARQEAMAALEESRPALSGNIASKGTSSSGRIGDSRDRYIALLTQAILKNFNVFAWQKNKNLNSVVYLEITPEGLLRAVRLVQKSGDKSFDQAVVRAVQATKAFPIPEDLTIIADGIEVDFKP